MNRPAPRELTVIGKSQVTPHMLRITFPYIFFISIHFLFFVHIIVPIYRFVKN